MTDEFKKLFINPHGVVDFISKWSVWNYTLPVSKTYIYGYLNNPKDFESKPAVAKAILAGIEAYIKFEKEQQAENQKALNKLLSSSHE